VTGNPFTYGNPISDPGRFFGRGREAEQIFGRLRNPEFESSSVVGDRRIGKTSLLNYIADPGIRAAHGLGGDSYAFVYADLQMVGRAMGPEQLWRRLLGSLREQCRDAFVESALKELLDREQLDIFDLDSFFRQADARGQHTVFLLDEFDQVTANPNFGPDFYFGFRSLAIHRKVALVTSSRLELVELCHSDSVKSSPFFNIFASVNLRMFSPVEVEDMVTRSLATTGIRFTGDETRQVSSLGGRNPFFVQAACSQLYDAHGLGLGAAEREAFLAERFEAEAAPHFIDLWGNSSDPHKIILTAAALLESRSGRPPGFTMKDLRRVYSRAEPTMTALERRGLIMRDGEGCRLFSSALGPWIVHQLVAELGEQQSFPEWLAQHGDARDQVKGFQVKKRRLRQVLPKIGPEHRQLVLAWAKDPASVSAMAKLLASVLSMVH
jgi:AAA-like domain